MGRRAVNVRKQVVDLLRGRPRWRLEPRTTPGATPLWCFVDDGEIELSVAAENGSIHLYVMEADREIVFKDASELSAWLASHKGEAFQEVPRRTDGKPKYRRFFEWG
jgi:hypothetical protein